MQESRVGAVQGQHHPSADIKRPSRGDVRPRRVQGHIGGSEARNGGGVPKASAIGIINSAMPIAERAEKLFAYHPLLQG